VPLTLDADGLLEDAEVERLARSPAHRVFAQQRDARLDLATWTGHATRFFDAELSLARPKRYGAAPPPRDGATLIVRPRGGLPREHTVVLRPRRDDDLADAGRASGGHGLTLLAARCPTVASVLCTGDGADADALWLAALLAGVLLGPVLTADGARLLGARSAREAAEAARR